MKGCTKGCMKGCTQFIYFIEVMKNATLQPLNCMISSLGNLFDSVSDGAAFLWAALISGGCRVAKLQVAVKSFQRFDLSMQPLVQP